MFYSISKLFSDPPVLQICSFSYGLCVDEVNLSSSASSASSNSPCSVPSCMVTVEVSPHHYLPDLALNCSCLLPSSLLLLLPGIGVERVMFLTQYLVMSFSDSKYFVGYLVKGYQISIRRSEFKNIV
jgi:hypothetical protein